MANEGIDRNQFGNRHVSAGHSRNSFQIASDEDIARIDRIELRPHDDRIAPPSDKQIDGNSTLTIFRQTDLHVTLSRIQPNVCRGSVRISTHWQRRLS